MWNFSQIKGETREEMTIWKSHFPHQPIISTNKTVYPSCLYPLPPCETQQRNKLGFGSDLKIL